MSLVKNITEIEAQKTRGERANEKLSGVSMEDILRYVLMDDHGNSEIDDILNEFRGVKSAH